ncbi:MAG: hypothetical protein GX381_00940 [Synergistaceae bacterium]|jgi:hypothetical protein|nr:hypothetical protein [Synergistaceae bacterium]
MAKSYLSVGIIAIVIIISFTVGIVVGFSVNLGNALLSHPERYKLIIKEDDTMMKFDSSSGKLWIYDPSRRDTEESPWIPVDEN